MVLSMMKKNTNWASDFSVSELVNKCKHLLIYLSYNTCSFLKVTFFSKYKTWHFTSRKFRKWEKYEEQNKNRTSFHHLEIIIANIFMFPAEPLFLWHIEFFHLENIRIFVSFLFYQILDSFLGGGSIKQCFIELCVIGNLQL